MLHEDSEIDHSKIRDKIRNDEELKIVREQLARAQSILKTLRKDILPKNPRMYNLMAQPCTDMVAELLTQINDYTEQA